MTGYGIVDKIRGTDPRTIYMAAQQAIAYKTNETKKYERLMGEEKAKAKNALKVDGNEALAKRYATNISQWKAKCTILQNELSDLKYISADAFGEMQKAQSPVNLRKLAKYVGIRMKEEQGIKLPTGYILRNQTNGLAEAVDSKISYQTTLANAEIFESEGTKGVLEDLLAEIETEKQQEKGVADQIKAAQQQAATAGAGA